MTINFGLIEVIFLAVLSSEFSTVTGNESTPDEVKMFSNLNSSSENLFDSFGIVTSEIGDGIVIGLQTF